MTAVSEGILEVGTRASFVSLGAFGGATDTGTVTHDSENPALYFEFYDPLGSPLSKLILVTANDPFTFSFQNTTLIPIECICVAVFQYFSPLDGGHIPSSEVVLS